MTFRNLCYFTIIFTVLSALYRVAYHFITKWLWDRCPSDISYTEYMYELTKSKLWKFRIKRCSFFESKLYSLRVIIINVIFIIIALLLLFMVYQIKESEYGVWLDILI